MNALLMVYDAINQIEEAAGCKCFLASECDPKPAMYARLFWEEPKPCEGGVWANGQGWAILPLAHSKHKKVLLEVVDALPKKEIYTFIQLIEKHITDGGRVEFSRIADVLYTRVSWSDGYKWELGLGKDYFDKICIKTMVERVNTSRTEKDAFLTRQDRRDHTAARGDVDVVTGGGAVPIVADGGIGSRGDAAGDGQ